MERKFKPKALRHDLRPKKKTVNVRNLGSIMNYGWHLKKNGRADATIETAIDRLKRLAKLCNIQEPEQVKETLATLKWQNSTKHNVATIYTYYLEYLGKTWIKPKYTKQYKIPFIPTETEIDSLISCGTIKTATLLQLLKETGARIGEIAPLKWIDIDLQRRTINITAEKGSNSRILPISTKLVAMLNNLPKINENVFQTNKHNLRRTFEALRKRAIKKLGTPRLQKISFHTFRHWKGTTEYHKTKDIIHVKTVLGHRNIESTMVYINIESALYLATSDEYTCKVAVDIEQTKELIEAGFEYITGEYIDGGKLFRKRK